jgi:NAD(P)H dehydrogenase (quinone)
VGILCAKRLRRAFAALYRMDTTTSETRARHLERVAAKVDRLIAG